MTIIKPSATDQDFQNWVQQSSAASRQPPESTAAPGTSFADQLALAKTASYIPSTGQGDDKNVHHRLPDGSPVTYDDIRRAVAEGRGDEDVSPYFTGQTNAQALAAHGFAESLEQAPRLVGGVAAVATRSWLSLLSSITDTFGFGEKIRTAMADDATNTNNGKPKSPAD
ncbi:MAG: hypothetical protein RL483_673 [Pseudomonadota bacterium]|jgi:hypothetical protein